MPLEEPSWWYGRKGHPVPALLSPLGSIYSWATRRRFARTTAYASSLPVICVGNFTAGGTGKTPTAIHIGNLLAALGETPVFLTRGHGGREIGPYWVNPADDDPEQVGDEPLLLARHRPTLICRDRARGARAIEQAASIKAADTATSNPAGALPSVIIMDDGLQNPGLAKDLSLAVVDGARGIGNGRVIPAGPLRAKLAFQLELADAVVINHANARPNQSESTEGTEFAAWLRQQFDGPVLDAATSAAGKIDWLNGTRVLAFAGIGAPDRFFNTLKNLGADIVATHPFPDHHYFSNEDAAGLLQLAKAKNATLVTTEKDMVRLRGGSDALGELKMNTRTLSVALEFSDREAKRLQALVNTALQAKRA